MSQRDSGYERQALDLYETPEWVTAIIVEHTDYGYVWEPAAGNGKMVKALNDAEIGVHATDITTGTDFLKTVEMPDIDIKAIITNPPYELAKEFIEHALSLTKASNGQVAMLLRTDFDHAKRRQHLFGSCPQFAKKIVLTKRIKWFEDSDGQPSFNHAWFVWDWKHTGSPVLAYH